MIIDYYVEIKPIINKSGFNPQIFVIDQFKTENLSEDANEISKEILEFAEGNLKDLFTNAEFNPPAEEWRIREIEEDLISKETLDRLEHQSPDLASPLSAMDSFEAEEDLSSEKMSFEKDDDDDDLNEDIEPAKDSEE